MKEGFKPLFRKSPVLELIGPLYSKGEGERLVVGLLAQDKHCNARGTVHGGARREGLAASYLCSAGSSRFSAASLGKSLKTI